MADDGDRVESAANQQTDPAGQTNGQATPNAAAQPDPDKITLSRSEYEQLQRNASRVGGMQKYVDKIRGYGLESDEEIDQWGPRLKELKQRGYTPDVLAMLTDPRAAAQDDPGGSDSVDLESLLDQKFRERDERDWLSRHQETEKSMWREVDKMVGSLFNDKTPEHERQIAKNAFRAQVDSAYRQSFFPDDHPIASQRYRPLDQDSLSQAFTSFKDTWTKLRGSELTAIADAAAASPPKASSTAGSGGGQGKPQKSEPLTRKEMLEAKRQKVHATIQRAVSNAGA